MPVFADRFHERVHALQRIPKVLACKLGPGAARQARTLAKTLYVQLAAKYIDGSSRLLAVPLLCSIATPSPEYTNIVTC